MTINGGSVSSSSTVNNALILGITIPLVILRTYFTI
jgi:hypothetical protein